MKHKLLVLAALAAFGGAAQAQDVYGGVGLPGLVTLGYAQSMGPSWGLRGEYAGGLNVSKDGVQDGVNVTGSFKANRAGVFADWYPFGGGFRLVGGLTMNNIEADLNAVGAGNATINNKVVSMVGENMRVNIKFPSTTPYIGIGYGHQSSKDKGLGFYADLGFMLGKFDTTTTTSLVSNGKITQTDMDAQIQTMRSSLNSLSVLPSASIGLTYRY
jgi:hypothetical protein